MVNASAFCVWDFLFLFFHALHYFQPYNVLLFCTDECWTNAILHDANSLIQSQKWTLFKEKINASEWTAADVLACDNLIGKRILKVNNNMHSSAYYNRSRFFRPLRNVVRRINGERHVRQAITKSASFPPSHNTLLTIFTGDSSVTTHFQVDLLLFQSYLNFSVAVKHIRVKLQRRFLLISFYIISEWTAASEALYREYGLATYRLVDRN